MENQNNSDQEYSCKEKMVFNNKNEAEASATTLEHQRGIKLKAYVCKECGLWHLSSK